VKRLWERIKKWRDDWLSEYDSDWSDWQW